MTRSDTTVGVVLFDRDLAHRTIARVGQDATSLRPTRWATISLASSYSGVERFLLHTLRLKRLRAYGWIPAEPPGFPGQVHYIPRTPEDLAGGPSINIALTCSDGAEDGIRTRDPHLGKVRVFVSLSPAQSLKCRSVRPVSSLPTKFAPVVERSTTASNTLTSLPTLSCELPTP
jgi:hypothetical protein